MPYKRVAGSDKVIKLSGLEDGEVEGVSAGALMFVCIFVRVGSGCGIICAVPFEAVARVRGHTGDPL